MRGTFRTHLYECKLYICFQWQMIITFIMNVKKIVFMRLSLPTSAFSMRTPLWPVVALCCLGRSIYFYIPYMVRLNGMLTWSVCRLPVVVWGTILLLCFLLSWASVISMLARAHPTWIFYLRILWSKGSRVPFLYVFAFELACVYAKCEAYHLVYSCLSFKVMREVSE